MKWLLSFLFGKGQRRAGFGPYGPLELGTPPSVRGDDLQLYMALAGRCAYDAELPSLGE